MKWLAWDKSFKLLQGKRVGHVLFSHTIKCLGLVFDLWSRGSLWHLPLSEPIMSFRDKFAFYIVSIMVITDIVVPTNVIHCSWSLFWPRSCLVSKILSFPLLPFFFLWQPDHTPGKMRNILVFKLVQNLKPYQMHIIGNALISGVFIAKSANWSWQLKSESSRFRVNNCWFWMSLTVLWTLGNGPI